MCLHFWPYSWKQSLCFSSIVKHRYGKSHKPAAPTRRQISQVNLTGSCSCCRVLSWVSRGGCDPPGSRGTCRCSQHLVPSGMRQCRSPIPNTYGASRSPARGVCPQEWHRWEQCQGVRGVCPRALIYLLCILESHLHAVVLSVRVFAMCFSRIVRYFLLEINRNFV